MDSTGLCYYGARYYDPTLGRFTQADTIVQAPYDPQSLNRYTYCRNNPVKYTDPGGHFFWIAAIIGAVIGAALGGISAAQGGAPIWKGMLSGALSGFGAGFGFTSFLPMVAWGAFTGAGGAALMGTNIGLGALIGGLGSGIGWGFGSLAGANPVGMFLASTATGALTGGIASELSGGSFGEGAGWGALYSGVGFVASAMAHNAVGTNKSLPQEIKAAVAEEAASGNLQQAIDTGRAGGGEVGVIKSAGVAAGTISTSSGTSLSDIITPDRILGAAGRAASLRGWKGAALALSTASGVTSTAGPFELIGGAVVGRSGKYGRPSSR